MRCAAASTSAEVGRIAVVIGEGNARTHGRASRKSGKPRACARGFVELRMLRVRSVAGDDRAAEVIVQAGTSNMLSQTMLMQDRRIREGHRVAVRARAAQLAQVDIKIFG